MPGNVKLLSIYSKLINFLLTIFGRLLVLLIIEHIKVESEQIDGDRVLPGVVLLHARQEGLREEEARDPERGWGTVVEPVLKKGRKYETS